MMEVLKAVSNPVNLILPVCPAMCLLLIKEDLVQSKFQGK